MENEKMKNEKLNSEFSITNSQLPSKHPRCNRCNALLRFEKAYGQVPDRVTCMLCGWEKMREVVIVVQEVPQSDKSKPSGVKREDSRPHAWRGTCPVCFRENIMIRGPRCSRCYKRIHLGRDVHAA
jgi:hypothetical protein